MSAKGFTNELARAQERPDCEELLRKLTVHHQFNLDHDKGLKPTWAEECDFVTMSGTGLSEPDDPEITLALVALAAATFDEKSYLGMMAAGPLENLLRNSNPNLLNRVIEEARRNERFKWMLSGIYLHAIHADNVEAVRDAIGDVSLEDPLPPRPWA